MGSFALLKATVMDNLKKKKLKLIFPFPQAALGALRGAEFPCPSPRMLLQDFPGQQKLCPPQAAPAALRLTIPGPRWRELWLSRSMK